MNRAGLEKIPLRANPFAGLGEQMHRVLFGLFLIAFALVWARVWLATSLLGAARWPEGLLVVLTVGTTLVSLTRQLPGQNVILAAGIIAGIGGGGESLEARTGIPFGPCEYTENMGRDSREGALGLQTDKTPLGLVQRAVGEFRGARGHGSADPGVRDAMSHQ